VVRIAISAVSGGTATAATNMTKVDSTQYTYPYTVQAGNGTANDTFSTGIDIAGNVITSTPTSGGSLVVDNAKPTAAITYSPSQTAYRQGTVVTLTATSLHPALATSVVRIAISAVTGGTATAATNMTKVDST